MASRNRNDKESGIREQRQQRACASRNSNNPIITKPIQQQAQASRNRDNRVSVHKHKQHTAQKQKQQRAKKASWKTTTVDTGIKEQRQQEPNNQQKA
jgi:hypothetical protein